MDKKELIDPERELETLLEKVTVSAGAGYLVPNSSVDLIEIPAAGNLHLKVVDNRLILDDSAEGEGVAFHHQGRVVFRLCGDTPTLYLNNEEVSERTADIQNLDVLTFGKTVEDRSAFRCSGTDNWGYVYVSMTEFEKFSTRFVFKRLVGVGEFAYVFEIRVKEKRFALKFGNKRLMDAPALGQFHNEIQVLEKIWDPNTEKLFSEETLERRNRNIVRIYGSNETPNSIYLILEYLDGVELFDVINNAEGFLSEEEIRPYFLSALNAVVYLHNLNIIHRDIKAENMIVLGDGQCKLVDFGTALDSSRQRMTKARSEIVGTPPFMSPDVLSHRSYTPDVDYWALGCLLYFMIYKDYPFGDSTDLKVNQRKISRGLMFPTKRGSKRRTSRLSASNDVSLAARNLIRRLLSVEKHGRIGRGALDHPWVIGKPELVENEMEGLIKKKRRRRRKLISYDT